MNKLITNRKQIYIKNWAGICNSCVIKLENNLCHICIRLEKNYTSNHKHTESRIADECFARIADIICWKFNCSLKRVDVYDHNLVNFKFMPKKAIDYEGGYKPFFEYTYDAEVIEILSAYRQAKNEENKALRYLMFYRMLEMFSRYTSQNIDQLITKSKLGIEFINDKRNKDKKISLLRYFRNKIHPTKNSFIFPYRNLEQYSNKINLVVNWVIADYLSKK